MPQSREESTLHKGGENVPMETSGPYRGELEQQINAEVVGKGEPATPPPNTTPPAPARDGSLGEKEVPNVTGANPKRTVNSRPE